MLSDDEFNQWCCCLKLSEKAQQEIQHVRSSAPSRRIRGAHNNVTGRYPSRKMGLSIQFEFHKVELPFIYQLEHDEDVLEYYDQPPSFKLSYTRLQRLHSPIPGFTLSLWVTLQQSTPHFGGMLRLSDAHGKSWS